jgi:hypothetical protein
MMGLQGPAWQPQEADAIPAPVPQQAALSAGSQQPAWTSAVQQSEKGVSATGATAAAKYWRRLSGTVGGCGRAGVGLSGSAPAACRMIASTISPSGGWVLRSP